MSFRRRTFPEVLDNLLVSIAGGVAAEAHPFPPPGATGPPYRHDIQQPNVADVVSIYGTRDGQPYSFRKDTDCKLLGNKQTLEWLEGAALPDSGTLVYFNYFPASSQQALTDLQVGSVVRTLSESIGAEIARLYAQLELVYQAGFIDTATGSSLDKVVALLGISRVTGGRATGEVQFARAPGVRGIVSIPARTRIMDAKGDIEYETTQSVTMSEAQDTIRVPARDLERNEPVAADTLTVLPIPIAGIQSVTNPAPTSMASLDETDAELRERAKAFLHGSERATKGALQHAVTRQQITAEIVETGDPGVVSVIPHVENLSPELLQRLCTAIEDARPVGVIVRPETNVSPRKVDLELRLSTDPMLTEQDLRAAHRAVRTKMEDYFRRLPVKEAGSINRIVGLILGVPGVQDVRLLSATLENTGFISVSGTELAISGAATALGRLQIADPNLPTVLSMVVTFPQGSAQPNSQSIRAGIGAALAYLNDVNAADLPQGASNAEKAKRVLSYNKLLHVVPLPPDRTPGRLKDHDDNPPAVTLPTRAGIAPYQLRFILTLESGSAQVLENDGETYSLTPFERLSLGNIELMPETADG